MSSRLLTEGPRTLRGEVALAAAVGLVALLGALGVMKIWHLSSLAIPLQGPGDGDFELLEVRAMLDRGWYQTLVHVGEPLGSRLFDFPQDAGSLGQTLVLLTLVKITGNAVVALNLFSLLSFATVAMTAYGVLRVLGIWPVLAASSAMLYSWLPFHFQRAWHHLNFGDYTSAPLVAWVILVVLRDGSLFVRGADGRWRSGRNLAVVGCLVFAGLSTVYYAAFAAVLLTLTLLFAAVAAKRRPRPSALAIGLAAAVALPMGPVAVGFLPSYLYQRENGTNPALATRSISDSERYALKPSILVLPLSFHRFEPFATVKDRYLLNEVPTFNESDHATLGVVGSLGLLIGIVALLVGGVRRGTVPDTPSPIAGSSADTSTEPLEAPDEDPEAMRHRMAVLTRHAGFGSLLSLAIGTLGGISMLIAVLVSPQIRSWNRIVVVLAFFAFLSLVSAIQRHRARSGMGFVAALAVAMVTLLALADQTRSTTPFVPAYSQIKSLHQSDAAFAEALVRATGKPEPLLYSLPYVTFPEGAVEGTISGYPFARISVTNPNLRFSWGAMSSRPEDWMSDWSRMPTPLQLAGARAAGMDAVVVAPQGFADPNRPADLLDNARLMGGGTAFSSPNRQFAAATLPRAEQVSKLLPPGLPLSDLRAWTLSPLRQQQVVGAIQTPATGLRLRTTFAGSTATMTWQLNDIGARRATVAGTLVGATAPRSMSIALNGSAPAAFTTEQDGTFRAEMTIRGGPSSLSITADSPEGGQVRIDNLRVLTRPGS